MPPSPVIQSDAADAVEGLFVCDSQGRGTVLDVFGSLDGVVSWAFLELMTRRANKAQ